jgi:hypothetical protein
VSVSGCGASTTNAFGGVAQEGGASSSSSSSGPGHVVPGSASSSSAVPATSVGNSGAELGQPGAIADNPLAEVQAAMQDVEFDLPRNGGIVRRLGQPIGKLSLWPNGKNIGVKCSLHTSCSIVVGSKVPLEACVLWLARGVPPPAMSSLAERAELKKQHQKAPKPRVLPPSAVL